MNDTVDDLFAFLAAYDNPPADTGVNDSNIPTPAPLGAVAPTLPAEDVSTVTAAKLAVVHRAVHKAIRTSQVNAVEAGLLGEEGWDREGKGRFGRWRDSAGVGDSSMRRYRAIHRRWLAAIALGVPTETLTAADGHEIEIPLMWEGMSLDEIAWDKKPKEGKLPDVNVPESHEFPPEPDPVDVIDEAVAMAVTTASGIGAPAPARIASAVEAGAKTLAGLAKSMRPTVIVPAIIEASWMERLDVDAVEAALRDVAVADDAASGRMGVALIHRLSMFNKVILRHLVMIGWHVQVRENAPEMIADIHEITDAIEPEPDIGTGITDEETLDAILSELDE